MRASAQLSQRAVQLVRPTPTLARTSKIWRSAVALYSRGYRALHPAIRGIDGLTDPNCPPNRHFPPHFTQSFHLLPVCISGLPAHAHREPRAGVATFLNARRSLKLSQPVPPQLPLQTHFDLETARYQHPQNFQTTSKSPTCPATPSENMLSPRDAGRRLAAQPPP